MNLKTLNSEWLRKPFSALEATLRLPYLIRYCLEIFLKRLFLFWFLVTLLTKSVWLGLVLTLIIELFSLRRWYQQSILPRHKLNLKTIKNLYHDREKLTKKELITTIERSVKLSAWGLIHIGYVGLAAYGWEYIFRWIYPMLVKTKEFDYHQLLRGFVNKTIESDQKLWEVAQIKDSLKQKQALVEYLDGYGSRVEDIDLSLPTFREQTGAIKHLLSLNRYLPAPKTIINKAKKNRGIATVKTLQNLRIPKAVFNWLLTTTQKNVNLREDRRFWEFLADYQIRQMILLLAKRHNFGPRHIFSMSWWELKHAGN